MQVVVGVHSLTLGLVLEEVVDLADGTVEGHNGESVISSIEDQVLSHDSQADEAEIAAGNTRILADINASKTCAKVSKKNASQLFGIFVLIFLKSERELERGVFFWRVFRAWECFGMAWQAEFVEL